jgi:hypothetical protein
MPAIIVHDLDIAREGRWEFRSGSEVAWCPPDRYGFTCRFDPFPAYPHDRATAVATAAHVQACCPPLWDVHCYLADREENSRSNGHSNIEEGRYVSGEWVEERTGLIMMSGKRIPPHPAMTRHLTGHEYGHNVAYMINSLRDGVKTVASTDPLYQEYAAVRGLPASSVHHGEGGTWHDSACEIFACDFRILVCGLEAEFWPHPGITRPERVPAVRDWWDTALAQLAGGAS